MYFLVRRPRALLFGYWTITLAMVAALFWPWHPGPARAAKLTLITGQVLSLTAQGQVDGPSAMIQGHTSQGDLLAYPANAGPALGTFLDPRLFDVDVLRQDLYDDAHSDTIPLLVRFGTQAEARAAVQRGTIDGGIVLTHAFEYIPYAAGYVNKSGPFIPATTVREGGITGIYLDGVEHIALDGSLPLIGVPAARDRGLTGKGVKIAIVDTGIDSQHPDLVGRVIAARDFTSDNDPLDANGHGTHVAGIAAGTGAASNGRYQGVAPDALLINAKALSRYGSGSDTGIIKAMEWAADQGARIESMSLGGGPTDGTDAMAREVNALTRAKGVLFVIAAGNSGPRGRVSSPGSADLALTVGAVNKSAVLAVFSSRGPRLKDEVIKPDIVAPGVDIMAPRANPGQGDPYTSHSGTSMATPMVSGAAALVFQLHPTWTALQVKDALMSSASPIGPICKEHEPCKAPYDSAFDQGAGMVNLGNVVSQVLVSEPASLSFGLVSGGARLERTFVLRNISNQQIPVRLDSTLRTPEGAPVAGLSVTPATFELSAQGQRQITVIVAAPMKASAYTGAVVITSRETIQARALVGVVVK